MRFPVGHSGRIGTSGAEELGEFEKWGVDQYAQSPWYPWKTHLETVLSHFFWCVGGYISPPPGRVCTFKKLLEMIIYTLYELPQIHYPYVRIFLKFQGGMYDPLSVWAVGAYLESS